MSRLRQPVLIIHAEFDHFIPFTDGQALYDACSSPAKTLLRIPGANHNDILAQAPDDYFSSIHEFISKNVTTLKI